MKTPYFISLLFILFFLGSCEEKKNYKISGIYEYTTKDAPKVIVQKEGDGYAMRKDEDYYQWEIFEPRQTGEFFSEKGHMIEMNGPNEMHITHVQLLSYHHTLRRLDPSQEGLWMLNYEMPQQNVASLLGEPDSIGVTERLTEWYYGNNKYIQFDGRGVKYFSENFKRDKDFKSIAIDDHYDKVIEQLGEPHQIEHHNVAVAYGIYAATISLHYGSQTRIDLIDSTVTNIILNKERNFEEWATLIDCDPLLYNFAEIPADSMAVFVEEKGKKTDSLQVKYHKNVDQGFIDFQGDNYRIIVRLQKNNTYKAMYSRIKKYRKYEKPKLEIEPAERLYLLIDPSLLKKGIIRGDIRLTIEEKSAKNTQIYGRFEVEGM